MDGVCGYAVRLVLKEEGQGRGLTERDDRPFNVCDEVKGVAACLPPAALLCCGS